MGSSVIDRLLIHIWRQGRSNRIFFFPFYYYYYEYFFLEGRKKKNMKLSVHRGMLRIVPPVSCVEEEEEKKDGRILIIVIFYSVACDSIAAAQRASSSICKCAIDDDDDDDDDERLLFFPFRSLLIQCNEQSFLVLFRCLLLLSFYTMLLEWFHLHLASSVSGADAHKFIFCFPPTPASPVSFSLSTLSISFFFSSTSLSFVAIFMKVWGLSIDYREIWKCQGNFFLRRYWARFPSLIEKRLHPFCTCIYTL